MPITIDCSECDHVLYETNDSTLDHAFLYRIVEEQNGRCPNCGHKLVLPKDRSRPTDYVQVHPFKATNVEVFTKFSRYNRKPHFMEVPNELVNRLLTTRDRLICMICHRAIQSGEEVRVSRNRLGRRYRHKTCYQNSVVK